MHGSQRRRTVLSTFRKLRWPDGFKCPGCASQEAWLTARSFAALCSLSPSDFYHGRNGFRGYTKTAEDMVSSNVVYWSEVDTLFLNNMMKMVSRKKAFILGNTC